MDVTTLNVTICSGIAFDLTGAEDGSPIGVKAAKEVFHPARSGGPSLRGVFLVG